MAAIFPDPRLNLQTPKSHCHSVAEEVGGLIRVYKDGQVERPPVVPSVSCAVAPELGVTAKDIVVEKFTNLWARLYVPSRPAGKLPLLVYFHGGGFCVGSAAWSCYHNFLANLSSKAGCLILSINYRLSPENRLPAAYEDGFKAVVWAKQQPEQCGNFTNMFLAGDSAGANIAHNVAVRFTSNGPYDVDIKGTILIQPFFGGEERTESEKFGAQPANSALTLSGSDTYWRLALPVGANRDHPWCNPLATGAPKLADLRLPATMVCVSEMDILKDRNLEFCAAMAGAGKRVDKVVYKGVGHAFQVLHNSHLAQRRTQDMISHIKAFINNQS